jgi:hypothetical protein
MAFIGKFTTVSSSLVWDGSKFISESLDTIVHSRAADKAAKYLVLEATTSLGNERVFTAGDGIDVLDSDTDGGNFTVSLDVRTGKFDGIDVRFVGGELEISAALVAGPGVVINNNAGALEISSSLADVSMLVVDFSSGLDSERKIAAGPGIKFDDKGANGLFEVSAALAVAPGLTLNNNAGVLELTASVANVSEGDYIDVTETNGDFEVALDLASLQTALDEVYADVSGAFVLTAVDADLPGGRALVGGDGIALTDGGAGGNLTIDLDVATGTYAGIEIGFNAGVLEVSSAIDVGPGLTKNLNAGRLELTASVGSLVAGPGITINAGANNAQEISSSFTYTTADVSSNLTVSEAVSFVDTSAARTLTLPSIASTAKGRVYIIKDATGGAGENNITVNVDGGSNIDGTTTYVMAINYGATKFIRGETQWHAL